MSRIEEPEGVRRWRDEHPRLTLLGLERELAACEYAGGPVEAFRAYLDAIDASARETSWTPPDRDEAMRALTIRVAQGIGAEGFLGQKRPFGNSDITGDVAEIVGIETDELARGNDPFAVDPESPCGQAREWCAQLWREWPEWLIEQMAQGGT